MSLGAASEGTTLEGQQSSTCNGAPPLQPAGQPTPNVMQCSFSPYMVPQPNATTVPSIPPAVWWTGSSPATRFLPTVIGSMITVGVGLAIFGIYASVTASLHNLWFVFVAVVVWSLVPLALSRDQYQSYHTVFDGNARCVFITSRILGICCCNTKRTGVMYSIIQSIEVRKLSSSETVFYLQPMGAAFRTSAPGDGSSLAALGASFAALINRAGYSVRVVEKDASSA